MFVFEKLTPFNVSTNRRLVHREIEYYSEINWMKCINKMGLQIAGEISTSEFNCTEFTIWTWLPSKNQKMIGSRSIHVTACTHSSFTVELSNHHSSIYKYLFLPNLEFSFSTRSLFFIYLTKHPNSLTLILPELTIDIWR